MKQQCPRCDYEFKLLNIRHTKLAGRIETTGKATFCPSCGVDLDSWDAYVGKVIIADDVEAVLVEVGDNGLICLNELTGNTFTADFDSTHVNQEQ